jgi:hypothetical protein
MTKSGPFHAFVDRAGSRARRLSGEYDEPLRAPYAAPIKRPHDAAAAAEESMLRYLGVAVIMRWSTLPPKVQREILDDASAMRELTDAERVDLPAFARHPAERSN